MNTKRTQTFLKVACLVLALIQVRSGNKFDFPTFGIMLFCLFSTAFMNFAPALLYFAGLGFLIFAIAAKKPQLSKNTFITGFTLLLIETALYQFYFLRDAYWSGTSIYLWTTIPFIVLGLLQIVLMFKNTQAPNNN